MACSILEVVPGQEEGEGDRFCRLDWPPPAEFFNGDGGVIGLAYYLQKWFRFHLQDWITRHARELEAKEGVYSLEGWTERRAEHGIDNSHNAFQEQVVSADGDYTNTDGVRLAAEIGLMEQAARSELR